MGETTFEEAVRQLHSIQSRCEQSPEIKKVTVARDDVRARYQAMFSADRIPQLSASDFKEFLLFKNNHHWTSLHRQGGRICQDMSGLRRGLLALHDRSLPIEARWDSASGAVKYLGPAILSAVLHILYPLECGVWNEISEASLKRLGVWPKFSRGASGGQRYKQINDRLRALGQRLNVDLWDLDALMWGLREYSVIVVLEEQILPYLSQSTKERVLEVYKRDSKESVWLKKSYGHQCQICGCLPFGGELGSDISEAHHIDFLSRGGADTLDNMMLLCPNHHAAIHMRDASFNWKTLSFEFAPDTVIALKLNSHLRPRM
jgi:hypothetical protein